ncbi:MAG: hypothetical protein J2P41_17280, partial [Blastocatellia bacterium]|nr:hypothetical protein [Blastocatellia bacterium]
LILGLGVAAALLLILGVVSVTQMLRLRGRLTEESETRIALVRQTEEADRQLAREREQVTEERKRVIALQKELGDVTSRLGKLEEELGRSQPASNQIVPLELAQGVRDDNKPYRVFISAFTRFVELHVILDKQDATASATYRAVLKTVVGDNEIWRQEGIKLQQTTSTKYLVFRVPARRFRTVEGRGFTLTLGVLAAGGKEYEELEGSYFDVVSR